MYNSELPSDVEKIIESVDDLKKKLLSVEAQRISRIMDNCISQTEIVATVPTAIQSLSTIEDKELLKELRRHKVLCERLERGTEEGATSRLQGEEKEKTRARLERDVKNSVKDLFRLLRSHPDRILALAAVPNVEIADSESNLIGELKGFHSHMLNKLLTSPFHEAQMAILKPAPTSLEQVLQDLEQMSSVEAEVAKAMQQIDAKISQKNMDIESLKQESLMSSLADETELKSAHASLTMQEKIDQLKIQLNISQRENTEALIILQKANEEVDKIFDDLRERHYNDIEEQEKHQELEDSDSEKEEEERRAQEELQDELLNALTEKKEELHDNSLMKQAGIQQQINQLGAQLDELKKNNISEESKLQKRNDEMNQLKEEMRLTYEKENKEKQAILEEEELENQMEETKLTNLQNAHSVLMEEYGLIQARLAEEQKERDILEMKIRAVTYAQAWWRGYCTRRALKNKAEGGGKGGKKGGKGGKGKKGKGKKKK